MKSLLAGLLLLVCASSANAAFTRDAGNNYATDDDSGLEWLALTETVGLSYNDASSLFDFVDGGGWRYATYLEVDAMFSNLFSGFISISSVDGLAYGNGGDSIYGTRSYAEIYDDVANFQDIFSATASFGDDFTLGLFENAAGEIKSIGTGTFYSTPNFGAPSVAVYSPEYPNVYDPSLGQDSSTGFFPTGVFLVRDNASTSVSEASSLFLLTFGLLGLLGTLKRKA